MARRLATSLATVAVAMTLTFILIRQMPGDVLHGWAVQIQMQTGIPYDQAPDLLTRGRTEEVEFGFIPLRPSE